TTPAAVAQCRRTGSRWRMQNGGGRSPPDSAAPVSSGYFSNAHINALVQLLKRGFDLIEPGSVIEPEESVNVLPVPSELTGELGARHTPLAQRHVENRLERRQERQFYPNTPAPLHLSLSGRPR